ncbi:MAG: DNA lyase [Syntrophaceae bacterium]
MKDFFVEKLESTIVHLCRVISQSHRNANWLTMPEQDLLLELVTAILGSQVPFEMAVNAAYKVYENGLLSKEVIINQGSSILAGKIEYVLKQPLYDSRWKNTGRRYRFPTLRAHQIAKTMENIYSRHGSLKCILNNCALASKARGQLVRTALGIGPKQASLFLRNIGYTDDLAILDVHVLRYMAMRGMTNLKSPPSSLNAYEKTENCLLEHSLGLGFTIGCLDQAIWVTMRVAQQEAWT